MNNSENKQDPQANGLGFALWKEWQHVDDEGCLKRISGGNLNGKTDINPVWRMRKLTELFGPVGIGWNVTEKERWTNECAGEVGAFVKVELRINVDGKWSEPIEGTGGSKLCGKGKGDGLNDEAWKMATTDAISVACKALGMAADVYTGKQSHPNTDGPDFGTKYEHRNYGQTSSQSYQPAPRSSSTSRGGNRAVSAPSTATPAAQQRRTVTLEMVNGGKAHNLVTALSKHDYDDLPDWQAGLAELRQRYDFAPGVIDKIQELAVAEREARIQHAIAHVPENNSIPA